MTLRALILGLLAAVLIATFGYANRFLGALTNLTRGHFPISVFGTLFVFVVVVNPLLYRVRANWRFRPSELAVILALVLVACSLPDVGLMRYFTPTVAMPAYSNEIYPSWKHTGVLGYAPPAMILGQGRYDEQLIGSFVIGKGSYVNPIGFMEVPWAPWLKVLATWVPMILMFAAASMSLAVVCHRNWASRERLRYPIAEFATMLMRQQPGRGESPIFRDKLFWVGFAVLLTIRVVNGLNMWFPADTIKIPLDFDFPALEQAFPNFMRTPGASYFAKPSLFPTAVALAFFLSTDISFSLGITNLFSVLALYLMIRAGWQLSGERVTGGVDAWLAFGSFAGFAAMIVYIGRRHYWQTLKQAVTLTARTEAEPSGVWGCRVFLVSTVGIIAMLTWLGLSWVVGVALVLAVLLMHFVMARMCAECGVFFFMPAWAVLGVLVGLFGAPALGPASIVIAGLFVGVFTAAPWECLMPYVTNGLKMTDGLSVKPGPTVLASALAFVLALAAVIPLGLWCDYNFGAHGAQATEGFETAARMVTELTNSGRLAEVDAFTTFDRILNIEPDRRFVRAAGAGLALVLLCSAMRLRFTWWPIHPVLFLCFAAWSVGKYSHSFLLGWLAKVAVMRLGGTNVYQRGIRLAAGVIAGDVLGGLIFIVVNLLYYAVTGVQGLEYVKSFVL